MSVNREKPHLWAIPEDKANAQILNGFLMHYSVNFRAIGINPVAGGWGRVLDIFEEEYVQYLRNYPASHVVMLIDFDEKGEARRSRCEQRIPNDLKPRTFLLGTSDAPEDLKKALNLTFEQIGEALAQDCSRDDLGHWGHPHLAHNLSELQRMLPTLKPIILQGS